MDLPLMNKKRPSADRPPRPRLGFLGVGWIGRHRLQSLRESGLVEIAAIADTLAENRRRIDAIAPDALQVPDLESLLSLDLDGVVIATPSGGHAREACAALTAGLPVFCQKPLGLDGRSTREVVELARRADLLLGVDLSYRCVKGVDEMRRMVAQGEIGQVFAADLVFHNAYGPDKPWYYDKRLAGGGCVIDLGTHLVDLMLQVLPGSRISKVQSHLFARGRSLDDSSNIEDYAAVQLMLESGASVRLACSWHLQAGREALIRAAFYGTNGGLCLRNAGGSFYHFVVEHYQRTATRVMAPASDDWWGRQAVRWAHALTKSPRYDPAADELVAVADILDAIYAAA